MNPTIRERIWSRLFVTFIIIGLFISVGVQALNCAIPLYIEQLGRGTDLSGILASIFALSAGLSRLFSGMLSDKRGRQIVMLVGTVIFTAGSVAPILFQSVELLTVFRFLQGCGYAAVGTAAGAAAADVLPKNRLGEGIGFFGLSQSLASALGPSVGIMLISMGDPNIMFGTIGALGAVLFLLSLTGGYPEDKARIEAARAQPKTEGPFLRRVLEGRALPPTVLQCVLSMGFAVYVNFISVYADRKGIADPGMFFTVAAVMMVLANMGAARIMDRVPAALLLIPSQVIGALSFLAAIAASGPLMLYLSGAGYGLCLGITMPLLKTVAIKRTPPERWGVATATFYLGSDVGMGLGGALFGAVISSADFTVAFLCGLVCMVITGAGGLVMLRTSRGAKAGGHPLTKASLMAPESPLCTWPGPWL